jgi:hypothetical protein
MARLKLFVEGVAPGSPLEMRTRLPAGMALSQPPADATVAGDLFTLPFDTAGNQRKERSVWLKLPPDAASATTSSTVHFRDADGQMKQYGGPATATLGIAESKRTAKDTALAALDRVGATSQADRLKLAKIKYDVGSTAYETTDVRLLWVRLRLLLDDVGTLERSRWTGAESARIAVARVVAYAQYDYYRAGGQ